jgi:hypothetical protein
MCIVMGSMGWRAYVRATGLSVQSVLELLFRGHIILAFKASHVQVDPHLTEFRQQMVELVRVGRSPA